MEKELLLVLSEKACKYIYYTSAFCLIKCRKLNKVYKKFSFPM